MIWLIISSLIGHQRSSVTVLRKQNLYRVLRLKSRFYLLQPIIFNIIIHRSPLTNNQPHEQDAHFQGWHLKCGWWIGDGYNFQGQDLKCGWWRGMPRASPPTCAPLEPYHPKNVIDNDSHLFWMFFFFQILESLNGDNYFKITQNIWKSWPKWWQCYWPFQKEEPLAFSPTQRPSSLSDWEEVCFKCKLIK